MQTVAWIGGIPYPTGFPGYAIVSWLWAHLVPFGTVAWRVNLLSALAMAGASAAVAAIALALGTIKAGALGAALVFAFSGAIWNHATYADVHPAGFAAILAAVLCAVLWLARGAPRAFVGAVLAAAVAVAIDTTAVLELAGLALLLAGRRPNAGLAVRAVVPALLVVLAVYAYLPLRSAYVTAHRLDPTLSLGVAPGRPFWDDHHPATWSGFVALVGGREFTPERALAGIVGRDAVTKLWRGVLPRLRDEAGEVVFWLGCFGALCWLRREPLAFAAGLLLAIAPIAFATAYPAEADADRYLPALYAFTVLAAASGAQALGVAAGRALLLPAAVTMSVAFAAILWHDGEMNRDLFAQPADHGAAAFVARVAERTPAHAILVAQWVNATPLAYGAYVTRSLGDRIVLTADPDEYAGEYRRWLRTRPVVLVSDEALTLASFRLRALDASTPHLYEVQ